MGSPTGRLPRKETTPYGAALQWPNWRLEMAKNTPDPCEKCGSEWFCSSPDYGFGGGAQFAHYCSRTGRRETCSGFAYSKADSYRDADRPDLAEKFGKT